MSRWGVVLVFVLVVSLPAAALASPAAADGAEPRIEAVAPNPVTDGNRGEYVVLSVPQPTNLSGWTFTDGTHTAELPNRTVEGTVAVGGAPSVTELLTDHPVYAWTGHLPLSAEGDELRLRDPDGQVVDSVAFPRVRNGDRWVRQADDFAAVPAGGTDLAFDGRPAAEVRAFVLPDAGGKPDDTIGRADERLLVAGYELTDPNVRNAILERHAAGVDVRVLVDGNPVGGQSGVEAEALDELADAGVPVRVIVGARDRYRFHHPKYAVVDDAALVMTENWKPSGTGGASSRGWGALVNDSAVADDLAAVFEADFAWRDTVAWERHREAVSPSAAEPTTGAYPQTHPPETVPVDSVQVVVAPEQAETALTALLANASASIDVQQMRIADPGFPLVEALLEAARRGVHVRIHLDSTWYVADENRYLSEELQAVAAEEDLPLEVRLADPADRYEKLHTKGIIVDEKVVVLGSMNWNNVSMRENREVMFVLEGEAVGSYYTTVFEGDWSPPGPSIPVGLVGAVVGIWGIAALLARRRVDFEA